MPVSLIHYPGAYTKEFDVQMNRTMKRSQPITAYLLLSIVGVFFIGCESNGPSIKNPYPNGKDTIAKVKDTWNYRTIQGLHAGLFKPTCANSGCHDGNFEPDFRTVESSYYSLVNQPVIKPDVGGKFTTRVIPFSAANSILPHRMTVDLNGNSGIMPLSLEANSNYPIEKDSWLVRINDWINAGAKDWVGNTPDAVDFPPQILGVQFLVNGNALPRPGKYEAAQIAVGQSPEIWISLTDDKTTPQNFKNVSINWSTDPAKFDTANEKSLKAGPSKSLPGLTGSNCDYYWNCSFDGSKYLEKDVVWFRITVSDNTNINYQIPNKYSMFLLKTYFAIKFN
jgi:hypothetical protein